MLRLETDSWRVGTYTVVADGSTCMFEITDECSPNHDLCLAYADPCAHASTGQKQIAYVRLEEFAQPAVVGTSRQHQLRVDFSDGVQTCTLHEQLVEVEYDLEYPNGPACGDECVVGEAEALFLPTDCPASG